jgi:hypothetical protein
MSTSSLVVEHRFRGPDRSGNGGYTAGRLALCVDARVPQRPVTVTLRQPPPLGAAMTVTPVGPVLEGVRELRYGDLLIATAVPGELSASLPPPIGVAAACAAEASYRGLEKHPFPGCFVCGPGREPGDGLRLAPGLVTAGRTACIWTPDPSLEATKGAGLGATKGAGLEATGDPGLDATGDAGLVGAEFVWSALDCPGGWTSDLDNRPLVLGRMTAEVLALPRVGVPVVVVGELLREEGRKTFTATALYDGDRLLARAEHTWLAVDPDLFN